MDELTQAYVLFDILVTRLRQVEILGEKEILLLGIYAFELSYITIVGVVLFRMAYICLEVYELGVVRYQNKHNGAKTLSENQLKIP